jgi:catechol 2,3-dioxygenase-like lactoylglutathione lyase family enzyme
MIRQIEPVFFTTDLPRTVAWYEAKLGFFCVGTWPHEPDCTPTYAIVSRDSRATHFRRAEPPTANSEKYDEELLDIYLRVQDADALHAEYAAKGVEFARDLGEMPWGMREFVVKDCDGRLLAFGAGT